MDAIGTFSRWLFIETERAGTARQRGEKFDNLDDAADQRDIAVEIARRLADYGIEFAAIAGIRSDIASDADHA